jgi:membrane protease YdiL (CAAX protease family)
MIARCCSTRIELMPELIDLQQLRPDCTPTACAGLSLDSCRAGLLPAPTTAANPCRMSALTDISAFARRHQLVLFFALAYAFSWWAWIWYRLDPVGADAPILPLGPLLAAVVMLALVGGRTVLAAWLAKILHWRVAPRWYLFVFLAPPALTAFAAAITVATGSQLTPTPTVPSVADFAVQFVFVLLWIGVGEEPAWRGYALPRLMARRNALTAALLLGAFHVVWHLPLFGVEYDLANGLPWAISVFCFSIVTAWMWIHTGGSLLLPILMHTVNNVVDRVIWQWFDGSDRIHLWWAWAGLWTLLTVVIVAATGLRLTRSAPPSHRASPTNAATATDGPMAGPR